LLGALVSHPLEALTVEGVDVDVVGLVGDQEIEDAQTSVRQLSSPGKRPITFVLRLTSPSERSSRFETDVA